MTEYQKALRRAAFKRNRAREKKEKSDNTLQMHDGKLMMRKNIRAKKNNAKRNKIHKTNHWQFNDDTEPATICGKMFNSELKRSSVNGEVTCEICMKMLKRKWRGYVKVLPKRLQLSKIF